MYRAAVTLDPFDGTLQCTGKAIWPNSMENETKAYNSQRYLTGGFRTVAESPGNDDDDHTTNPWANANNAVQPAASAVPAAAANATDARPTFRDASRLPQAPVETLDHEIPAPTGGSVDEPIGNPEPAGEQAEAPPPEPPPTRAPPPEPPPPLSLIHI